MVALLIIFALSCSSIRVIDGDTIVCDGLEVRLYGVDTPETKLNAKAKKEIPKTGLSQSEYLSLGKKAKSFTKNFVLSCRYPVKVDIVGKGKWGRLEGIVTCGNDTLQERLIENHLACIRWDRKKIFEKYKRKQADFCYYLR